MALKRIIDEEHSIRDIIKPLLKGTFDACSYLSQQHSRAAHSVLTSAKLPALSVPRNPISHVQLLPLTDPSMPAQASSESRTDISLPPYPSEESEKVWQTEAVLNTGTVQEDISGSSVPEPIDAEEDEEISPFTGNLPSISKKIVESTLVPVLSEKRSPSGSLWSYAKTQKSTRSSGSLWSYSSQERDR
jgi:hypothetical protein